MAYLTSAFMQNLVASGEWEILFHVEGGGAFSDSRLGTAWHFPWMSNFKPARGTFTAIRQKLQPTYGRTSLAKTQINLIDRDEWKDVAAWNYTKNKRSEFYIGPRGGNYDDFYKFFTGIVINYRIKGEILQFIVEDDLYVAKAYVPEPNDTNTQYLHTASRTPTIS